MQNSFIIYFWHYYKVFKRYTGKKLYLLTFVIAVGGACEVFGIALFVPLLNQSDTVKKESFVVYFYKTLDYLNIPSTFNSVLLILAAVFLVKAIIMLIQHALSSYIKSELTKDLRQQMLSSYINMKYSYYLNKNVGYLNNIITTEIERAVNAFAYYCLCIVAIVYILMYFSASIIMNWEVSLIAVVTGMVLFCLLRFFSSFSRKYSILTSEKNASLQMFLIQTIQYFKYLKATGSFRNIRCKLYEEFRALADYNFKHGMISGSLESMKEAIVILFTIGLIYYQVSITGKNITEVMVILLLFYKLVSRLFSLQNLWISFNINVGGVETVVNTFEETNKNIECKGEKKVVKLNESIRLVNVDFSFADKQILFDINIKIPRNQVVGVVGESGSGKTTLVDLITGLLGPNSGNLYFDDIDYQDIEMESLRLLIGYVTQENVVFHDSIANNITLGNSQNNIDTISKVRNAAKDAFCDQFVQDTESGYQTIIGDRGIKLSGGQRQRLSIARELYKEPELLIFDEATSALDSKSESFIQKSIDNLKGSKTIILIAHRLSTIKKCDYIYVLSKGRIIEEGAYNELYNGNTRFRKMCLNQQL